MYLQSIGEFLAKCGASIMMCEKPKVLRENYSFIMDHVIRSKITRTEINMVHKTRLFLQVETAGELANPDGTRIEPAWMSDGSKPLMVHQQVAQSCKTFQKHVESL